MDVQKKSPTKRWGSELAHLARLVNQKPKGGVSPVKSPICLAS
jgi:hypothetical protein